jgi:cell division protein FtsL
MKKKKAVVKRNKYLILFLIVFLSYIGYSVIQTEIRIQELRTREATLKEELMKLTEEKDTLTQQLEESKSLESIERIAREKLKMVKPNEVIYIIQDDKK